MERMEKLSSMEKEFVPYTLALALKELGFDEPCFGFYDDISKDFYQSYTHTLSNNNIKNITKAPLYQQAFRWFREKYHISGIPTHQSFDIWQMDAEAHIFEEYPLLCYEEAELACLKKLIQIVKEKL